MNCSVLKLVAMWATRSEPAWIEVSKGIKRYLMTLILARNTLTFFSFSEDTALTMKFLVQSIRQGATTGQSNQ